MVTFQKKYAHACTELDDFLAPLSEAQLSGPSDAMGWTLKDHIAHLADWQAGMTALLKKKDRWAAMDLAGPPVGHNQAAYDVALHARHIGKSAKQVLSYLRRTQKRFDEAISALSDADLRRPYAWYDPSGDPVKPVEVWLDHNTWEHYAEHIAWMKQILIDDLAGRK
ncbi:MAG: maleylpyruvate isomerase N-terminal domain-containing protein [Anaerolineae bacterium]